MSTIDNKEENEEELILLQKINYFNINIVLFIFNH